MKRVRGAGVVEYGLLLAGVSIVGFFAMSVVGGEGAGVARWEGACVKAFECTKARGEGAGSIGLEERTPTASFVAGARGEALAALDEVGQAAVSPGDVLRGAELIAAHPMVGVRALVASGRPTSAPNTATSAETSGAEAARAATCLTPAVLGRVATIGRVLREGGSVEQWALPPPPAAPEVLPAEAPGPAALPSRATSADAGADAS